MEFLSAWNPPFLTILQIHGSSWVKRRVLQLKRVVSLFLVLFLIASLGGRLVGGLYLVGDTVMASESIGVRQARVAGREVGEVLINGQVVLRVRTSAGGLSPFQRAAIIGGRLASCTGDAYLPDSILPDVVNGNIAVSWRGDLIVTVDADHARLNYTTQYLLAKVWANNMRRALGCGPVPSEYVLDKETDEVITAFCTASWYGEGFHGQVTASGEVFDSDALTAAHRYLPFGTRVRVTNLHNGSSVVVTINDRGPYVEGRVIDLSKGAAIALGMKEQGIGPVKLEVMGSGRVI
ncbi:MAG: septal ring lytic transglycosylase RlpA family protein [Firmicutes bacterium]|nr:septal ring lytic transglycosylase RlpA family protein [Bacillota bacterium]